MNEKIGGAIKTYRSGISDLTSGMGQLLLSVKETKIQRTDLSTNTLDIIPNTSGFSQLRICRPPPHFFSAFYG